jgi:flagellar hook capping protein FlgD
VVRVVPTLLVAVLLGATAAAFAVTQGLKLERSAIYGTEISKVLGPRQPASVRFKLRRRETVTVTVVDGHGRVVRTLIAAERHPAGTVTAPWNGRTDDGALAPPGVYHLRVRLAGRGSAIRIPNAIRLDSTPPSVQVTTKPVSAFSPDGDGHSDRVVIRYRTDESTQAILTVDGFRAVLARPRERLAGSVAWSGKVGGRKLLPRRYTLRLRLRDAVGNVSAARVFRVRLRYVELPARLVARAGARFRVPVDTDARTVRWTLAGRSGLGQARTLSLRAPAAPGRYRLVVSVDGHSASAPVVVRPAR